MTSDVHDFSQGAAFVEGRYVPAREARVSLLDWGFTRSDVTYDVVHVREGGFFRLDDHLDRFERSLAGFRLAPPHGPQAGFPAARGLSVVSATPARIRPSAANAVQPGRSPISATPTPVAHSGAM